MRAPAPPTQRLRGVVGLCGLVLSATAAAATGPNLLLITVDGLRPDALGWVARRNDTPRIDALAAGGFRFPAALAPAPLTLPASASALSGLVPRRHGVRTDAAVLPSETVTLAQHLAWRGWSTAAFVGGAELAAFRGLDRGFARYDDVGPEADGGAGERPASEVVAAALAWLAEAPQPWFVWLAFHDPQPPYVAPRAFLRPGLDGAYFAEVAFVDHEIGRLLDGIAARGFGPPVFALAGSHGTGLGEHGEDGNGAFLYDSTLAVPLIFVTPGLAPGESPREARLIDVVPTLLELAGVEPLPAIDGVSLVPTLSGREQEAAAVCLENAQVAEAEGWPELAAVRRDQWKYVLGLRPGLYRLAADPGEEIDRLAREPARGRRLADELARCARATPVGRSIYVPPVAAALLDGLVESAPPLPEAGPLPAGGRGGTGRPREELARQRALWSTLRTAATELRAGNAGIAAGAYAAVLGEDPDNPEALRGLGRALLAAGDLAAALPPLVRATALRPAVAEGWRLLASGLAARGDAERAVAAWARAVRLEPRRAADWEALAQLLAALGRDDERATLVREAAAFLPLPPDLALRLGAAPPALGAPPARSNPAP